MPMPKILDEVEGMIARIDEDLATERFLRTLLSSMAEHDGTPPGAIGAALQAMIDYNREEWVQYFNKVQ